MDFDKNKNLFSKLSIMNKNILRNSNYLSQLGRKGTGEAKQKIDTLVELYKLRKISQLQTAERVIKQLVNTDPKDQKKGFKKADKIIDKYKDFAPLNQRLKESRNQNKSKYIISVLLFDKPGQKEDETDENFKARVKKLKLYKKTYVQIAALSLNVKG